MMYVIKNVSNQRYIRGSDFNYTPPEQLLCESESDIPMLFSNENLTRELARRKINLALYQIIPITIKELL